MPFNAKNCLSNLFFYLFILPLRFEHEFQQFCKRGWYDDNMIYDIIKCMAQRWITLTLDWACSNLRISCNTHDSFRITHMVAFSGEIVEVEVYVLVLNMDLRGGTPDASLHCGVK
jgi:hypothetical protein